MLNIPVNNFSVMSGRSHRFLSITSTFQGVNVSLLKDTTWRRQVLNTLSFASESETLPLGNPAPPQLVLSKCFSSALEQHSLQLLRYSKLCSVNNLETLSIRDVICIPLSNCFFAGQRKPGMKCWWMTERSLEWILLNLRTVLSGEAILEEDLSNKPNPR